MPGAHCHLSKPKGKAANGTEMPLQKPVVANASTILKIQSGLYFPTQDCISEGDHRPDSSRYLV